MLNFQVKEREENIRRVVERKSLLPRMIYLSIHSASASLKENLEVNGSVSDPKLSSEFKYLLARYAKILGFSLNDAIEVLMGVSNGLKSFEVRYLIMCIYNHMFLFSSCFCFC